MAAFKFFLLSLFISYSRASPLQPQPREGEEYRLPETINPVHYTIHLTLEQDIFVTNRFAGDVELEIIILEAGTDITLQANGLTFSEVTLTRLPSTGTESEENVPLVTTNFQSDPVTDILIITSSTALEVGVRYRLHFVYDAILRFQELYGFYESTYIDVDGQPRELATTQFQPTHARKVFPCFDEPSFKATFDISITHPSEYTAVGNTVGERINPQGAFITTVFERTPIMSSYLIAFIVSDFSCTDGAPFQGDIAYRVCSRKGTEATRNYALDIGPKLIAKLEEFTGITFTESGIRKMDQFAIPDFAAGAMENWGLVTYRETALLWDPVESSNSYKRSVATIIAHEFSHMWFGNLLTTHWWSDTFLNEGFATYFESFTTAEVETTWEMDKQFVILDLQPILQSDASSAATPLSSPASSPSEVRNRFGSITYSKGGSIFRMVESFMGRDKFKSGIHTYLDSHRFSNAAPTDLWDDLATEEISLPLGTTLHTVMDNWVNRAGFPILTVTANGNNVVISQKRFVLGAEPLETEKWYVPISYTTSSDTNKFEDTLPRQWLLPTADLTILNVLSSENGWIVLNNQQTGYYRINYDDTLWDRIRDALNRENFDGIHDLNRAQIVDDLFNLARYDQQRYTRVFELTSFLRNDDSYYPWYSALTAINTMFIRTGSTAVRDALTTHVLEQIDTFYNSVPFWIDREDQQVYTQKKVLALTWACRLGHAGCVNNSTEAYQNYRVNSIRVNKNLKTIVYCTALRNSEQIQIDWQFLWEKYLSTDLATEKATILSALGCATDPEILNEYLRKSVDPDSGIRSQDALSVFSAVYQGNPSGIDLALDFFIENFNDINAYYGSMSDPLVSITSGLSSRFTRQDQIDKLRNFLQTTTNLDPTFVASANAYLGTATNNLQWTESFEQQLIEHFQIGEPPGGSAVQISLSKITMTLVLLGVYYLLK